MKNEAHTVLHIASINCSRQFIKTKKSKLFRDGNLDNAAHGKIRQTPQAGTAPPPDPNA